MPKLHIDEVYPKDSTYQMVVNFQNGYTTEKFKSKSCLLLKDKFNGEKSVVTEVSGLVYAGKEEQEDLGKTLILARNKITGKVRVIEVGNVELKPYVKQNSDQSVIGLDNSKLELSRKFGSKKQKQHMEQKEKLKINVQTVTEQMQNVTESVTEDQLDISSYIKTDSDDFYIPPINRQATSAREVYDMYKILSEDEYERIYNEIKDSDYMEQIQPWIRDMIATKDLSKEHTVLVVYASTLLKLFSTTMRDIVKKNYVAYSLSPTLNDILLKNFTTFSNGKRNRPMPYKDKTFCHVLVFLLIVNNFKCDIDELSKHMKYSAKTMMTKFRVIGATVVTMGDKKIAQLKLPLATVTNMRRKSAKF
ncbi:DNA-directed RNA polymerase I subunit RPA49-like [Ostrinia furnacalis]|uniref:DNA-directed RNA polymerase I subunit RPA49-like n=1 Tax=Ostrinia furnacalis TaxID=93504 RepID=UPI00103CB482|nr:DNA-directed RNA polymerase I subunit RPA49-like [Ostrinia furnacalis]